MTSNPSHLFRPAFRTTLRANRAEPNANGYFVQNPHGATVAGPFETAQETWSEEDRLRAAAKAADVTAKARATYAAACSDIGTTIEDETSAILSIGRDLLPPCAVAVLDGAEPTADYWEFCQEQTDKAQREHAADNAAGHEWHH